VDERDGGGHARDGFRASDGIDDGRDLLTVEGLTKNTTACGRYEERS